MEMSVELLIPGMQDGDKAGFTAEIIMAEHEQCLGGGIEQDFQGLSGFSRLVCRSVSFSALATRTGRSGDRGARAP